MNKANKPQQPAAKKLETINPRTEAVIAKVELTDAKGVQAAVHAAHEAFVPWALTPASRRLEAIEGIRDHILQNAAAIANVISEEQGKPLAEAMSADILPAVGLANFVVRNYGRITTEESIPMEVLKGLKSSSLVWKPLGVIAVVTPWNFPFSIPLSSILFALAAGNTGVFKPASEVPVIGTTIQRCIVEGGKLPEGVFNLVLAPGRDVGDTLFSPPVKKVVFTGSSETGKWIQKACAEHLIPTVLELGGKDPFIVLEDADIELAAQGAVWGAFANCGQVCASVERVYVVKEVYEQFLHRVLDHVSRLRLGTDGVDDYEVGPLVNAEQLEIVEQQVKDALHKGANVLAGGKRPAGKGYFYEPTVLTEVDHTMAVMTDETFGPLMPIMQVDDAAQAIELANDSPFGLTASVWTRDREWARRIALQLDAGTVTVNDHGHTFALAETPWHGAKESGIGVTHGAGGLKEFMFPMHLHQDNAAMMKRRMWWYPYSSESFSLFHEFAKAVTHKVKLPAFAATVLRKKQWRKAILG